MEGVIMTEEQIKKKADKYLKAYTDRSIHITKDRLLQLMIREVFIDGYHEGFKDCAKSRLNVTTISDCPIKDEEESKYKTAYIKGIRTMANALKDYDRTDGAWTDYFEHTVDNVLNRLLKESE
jgi:hypothetical protein